MKLRLILNPHYLYAHRHEMPTRLEILALVFCIVAIAAMGYLYDSMRMREEGADADAQRTRVLDACNKGTGLGTYVSHDGAVWELGCQFVEHRRT